MNKEILPNLLSLSRYTTIHYQLPLSLSYRQPLAALLLLLGHANVTAAPNLPVLESAGTSQRQTFIDFQDGTVLLIDRDKFEHYDRYSPDGGTTGDNFIDLANLKSHVNSHSIYEFRDSSDTAFDITTLDTARNHWLLNRSNGTTYIIESGNIERWEDYDSAKNDNAIDIDTIANNINNDGIYELYDSSGGTYNVQGLDRSGSNIIITRSDASVFQIDADRLNHELDELNGAGDDGRVDVDAISTNVSSNTNIYQWIDSSGQTFEFGKHVSTGNQAVIARSGGELLVVETNNQEYLDKIGGTTDDNIIDVEVLSSNVNSGNIYRFIDSTGGFFELIPLAGEHSIFGISRENGKGYLVDGKSFEIYEDWDTSANDNTIDIEILSQNVNTQNVYEIRDSLGPFTIGPGADDTHHNDIHFGRSNNELLTIRYDSFETYGDRVSGNDANDNIVNLDILSANIDQHFSYKYIASSGATGLPGSGYDSDNDMLPNYLDPDDNNIDTDGDGIHDGADVDVDGDGTNDNGTDTDGDGINNASDVDVDGNGTNDNGADTTDGDGITDSRDPFDNSDSDGDLLPNYLDPNSNNIDTDDDGIHDGADVDVDGDGTYDNGTDTDRDGINNTSDVDVDGNGTNDNGADTIDGDGITDTRDPFDSTDADSDLLPNYLDPNDNNIDTDDDGIHDGADVDVNGDGTNDNGTDTDGDGINDVSDVDADGDGSSDNGTDTDGDGTNDANDLTDDRELDVDGQDSNGNENDSDADGISDFSVNATTNNSEYLDLDIDNDGIPNTVEGNLDTDNDGIQNFRDLDSDNDGIQDVIEAGGTDENNDGAIDNFSDANADGLDDAMAAIPFSIPDSDGDGVADFLDPDSDQDGLTDLTEAGGTDTNNDGRIDNYTDTNADGWADSIAATPLPLLDSDRDGQADFLDIDSDNDGHFDITEAGGIDNDNDGRVDGFRDSDGDGIPDTTDVDATKGEDIDNDGIDDRFDVSFVLGDDSNVNGIDDRFEVDIDGDGLATEVLDPNQIGDSDGDGISDVRDNNGQTVLRTGVSGEPFGCSLRSDRPTPLDPLLGILVTLSVALLARRRISS